MSTEITRGPNVCPSCGEANPPTAAYCRLCATALGAAIQKTPSPAPVPFYFPPSDLEQMPRPPMNRFMAFASLLGVMILLPIAFIITFVAVCSVTTSLSSDHYGAGCLATFLGGVAGIAVVAAIVAAFRWIRLG
jgi:hypothetical protein